MDEIYLSYDRSGIYPSEGVNRPITHSFLNAVHFLGGLGLFLLGMIIMTEGLRNLAGNAMRRALMQFTRSPISSVITGAVTTAILQSSSATTVATVGFVSAGLISFSASLGIIFGANIGTTFTGWIVALLGFKLKLGTALLPLLLIGASLKLITKGRWEHLGFAIAGFGLIFVGISGMQDAMSGIDVLSIPEIAPSSTLLTRLQLVVFGMIATVITQSSSAGVAATLAALYSQTIVFEQAAALIIGMDVGTTITAILASLGASVNARRTGLSHVLYNIWTATIAFFFISPYMWLLNQFFPGMLDQNAEIALVALHTSFNLIGVLSILPFLHPFTRLIMRLIPDQGEVYTGELSPGLLTEPELALNSVQSSIQTELLALLGHVSAILGSPTGQRVDLAQLQIALDETHNYLDQIHLTPNVGAMWERLINMIHALDHLQRIHERCEEDADRAKTVQQADELTTYQNCLIESIQTIMESIQANQWQKAASRARATSDLIHRQVRLYRATTVHQIASDGLDIPSGTGRLEAIRWLRRVSKHIMRITHHMNQAILAVGQ